MDLGLWSGSSSSSPRPVRINYVLKKEAVCEWEGSVMAAQCRRVEDKSTAKTSGTEEKAATRGQRRRERRFQKHKEEKMGEIPGGPVAKNLCSQCRGLGSIPDQGTINRSHMLQLRVRMPQ